MHYCMIRSVPFSIQNIVTVSPLIHPFMAPTATLTSNSFLLAATPHTRINLNYRRLTVISRKRTDDSSTEDAPNSGNSSPFRFDFGKLPDVKSLVPLAANPASSLGFGRRKDPGTVFVAGASGQVGVRIAQTLLRQGFSVRAGVPDLSAAQELALLAAKYKIISADESKRLNAVNSTFNDVESIAKAIGNAGKVVVTIGPAENGPSAEVTISDALQVIQAAQLANVAHVAIVCDGSIGGGSSYNVLDGITSFFSNLFSKSQPLTLPEFLQKVVETDLRYTLIKTNITEDFSPESSYNLVVAAEGSSSADYKVPQSKIAALVADVFSNTAVTENKVVKVYADPTAPTKAIAEVFSGIPEDKRRQVYAEALAKAKAEEETLRSAEQAREVAEASRKQQSEEKRQDEEALAARLAVETTASFESLFGKAKDMTSGLSWENFSSQLVSAVQKPEEPQVQVATVKGQAKARSLPSLKAVAKTPARKPPPSKSKIASKPNAKPTESKTETRKVFGGLFQQETIYIDD